MRENVQWNYRIEEITEDGYTYIVIRRGPQILVMDEVNVRWVTFDEDESDTYMLPVVIE